MQTKMAYSALLSILALSAGEASHAQDTAPGAAENSASGEKVRNLPGGPPEISDELLARARAAAERGRARERSPEAEAYSRSLREALGLMEDGTNEDGATPPDQHQTNLTTVAFVSSSVPLPVLRAYAAQLEDVGGHFVFRGMPGGMAELAPFVRYSMEILKVDSTCEGTGCAMRNVGIMIDPLLFRSAGVTRVPGVTVLERDVFESYCQRQDEPPALTAVSFGDVHIYAHLDELSRLGDRPANLLLNTLNDQGAL
jgi:type-F conjugative transfer system pilin assembly protein TrbC